MEPARRQRRSSCRPPSNCSRELQNSSSKANRLTTSLFVGSRSQNKPIGWHPDVNDGVRMNIRPFMAAADVGKKGAGILRIKPNISWAKTEVKSRPE